MNFNIRRLLAKSLCILVAFSVTSVNAIEIEEIVVTAQKRAQNQQDVPVALDAFSGEMLQKSSIKTMRDLAGMTPSLDSFQSQSAGFSSWGIRGISTSSQNFGLESAVGSYIDNVYRARQSAISNQLVDVEAVEVLRGPQGTLYGKNTSAGAVNIRTVAPSHDRNGFFEIVGGDLGLININAATNMSLIEDKLAMRATIFSSDRGGFVTNLTEPNGPKMNDRDRFGGRLQFLFTPSENTSMRLIMDYAEIDEICCAALTKKNNFLSITGTPGTDFLLSSPAVMNQPVALEKDFNKQQQYLTYLPGSKAKDKGISLEINRDYDNFTLTSVTALRDFSTDDFGDVDFGAAYLLTDRNIMEQSSFSQELRFSGDFDGANGRDGHYQLGFYYYNQDLDNDSKLVTGIHTTTFLNFNPLLTPLLNGLVAVHNGTTAGIGAAITANPTAYGLPATATAAQITAVATGANPYPSAAASSFPDGAYARDVAMQNHKSYAFFGQVDIPIQDHWTLTAGMRYTNEDKKMDSTFTNSTLGAAPNLTSTAPGSMLFYLGGIAAGLVNPVTSAAAILPALAPVYTPGWGYYTQPSLAPRPNVSETLEDHRITGNVKVAYQPNDDLLFYSSYSTGYKAGGTNTDRLAVGLPYTFEPETTEVFEVGGKMDLGDSLRLNIAAWKMNVDNLQVSTFQGNAFNLQNAGYTEASGGEIDMNWAPVESFQFDVSYALVRATLKDFPNASCWIASPFHTGAIDPGAGTAGAAASFCDHTGVTKTNPERRLFVAATQGFKMGKVDGYLRLEHQSVSESDTGGGGDPLQFRESFSFANARLGFIFEELNSELAFWVRNATDQRFYESVFNNPVQAGSLRAYTSEPRTWGVNFKINFD